MPRPRSSPLRHSRFCRRTSEPVHERQASIHLPAMGATVRRCRHAASLVRPAQRRYLTFLLLVAPIVILRLSTAAYPIAQTAYLSLTNSSLLSGTNEFIGLENYRALANDFGLHSAIRFTIVFVLGSTLLQLVVGLLIALLLNARFRGRGFARSINLIPWAIPPIVAAYAFRWLLDDQFGLIPYWINVVSATASRRSHRRSWPNSPWSWSMSGRSALHGGRLPGRTAGRSRGPLRGGQGRRRQRVPALLGDHAFP